MGYSPWGHKELAQLDYSLKVKMKVTRLCPTLCDPMDYTVNGVLYARILEWVAYPSPGDLSDPEIDPGSLALQVDSLPTELSGKPRLFFMYP